MQQLLSPLLGLAGIPVKGGTTVTGARDVQLGRASLLDTTKTVAAKLTSALDQKSAEQHVHVCALAASLLDSVDQHNFPESADLLNRTCFFLFEIGKSQAGITIGKRIAARAEEFGDIQVQRRVSNILGGQYVDIANFAAAMEYLQVAVALARRIGDETIEAACLANVIAVLQEMGHYRQAIAMAERVVKLADDSQMARMLKLQCASNGLFSAHRIGDTQAADRFLAEGQAYLEGEVDPLRRAFFEKGRVLYLVDLGRIAEAEQHFADTFEKISDNANSRIRTLLTIASAICDWASGQEDEARRKLIALYEESESTRLYHHFVLQALIKVYSNALTPQQVAQGLAFARELVEFTTSVKKAKFYRQLADRREATEQRQSNMLTTATIDPFGVVHDWLSATDVNVPPEPAPGTKRVLAKHEELTAIHEDMAKLRAAGLRRDIRTDAVDTAENWAIAAELFDDETGQHCFRVGHLASMLAREIGMSETFCVQIEHAARLHDIGKIAVNELILLKPGPLDAAEMAAMRLHTEVGAQILSGSDDPTLKMAVEVARHHHEWWNGCGYPMKLTASKIPVSARISAFADVYDALTHARSYKVAWSHERALDEITSLAGSQFDPDLLAPFCKVLDRYRQDLHAKAIPGFADMDSNTLISSRRKLMETIGAPH